MPITIDQVRALPVPDLIQQQPYETQRDNIVSELKAQVPNWNDDPDDLLYKMVENTADARYNLIEALNNRGRQYFLAFAEGNLLDARAMEYGLTRNANESDDAFKLRIMNRLEALSPSTYSGILANAKAHPTLGIVDASIDITNLQQPILYAAKAEGVVLTAQEIPILQAWMRHPDRSSPGFVTSVGTATRNSYIITATIHYDARYTDRTTLENNVRRSVYIYIRAHMLLNTPINRANLYDALVVPGVIDVDPLTTPAADIAAAPSQIPVCTQDNAGVILTFMDVSP